MAMYKVEKTYYVEANSDAEAWDAANKQRIASVIAIGLATKEEIERHNAEIEAADAAEAAEQETGEIEEEEEA